jgi:hypothetical protein
MRFLLTFLLVATLVARAHDGLDLDPPIHEQDAWSVIQICSVNVDKLVTEQQWSEIPIQIALIGQGARFLRDRATPDAAANWNAFDQTGIAVIRAAIKKNGPEVVSLHSQFRSLLAGLEKATDPKLAKATVFSCPMCRGIRELDPKVTCFKCGMALVPRVIPASSVYNTPGEPSIALTPMLDAPLEPNQARKVRIKFVRKKDNAPVRPEDLLVVHTERIHLLIVDESLADYHHEHPVPSDEPGVYEFTLTPRRNGPYRVFADIVPAGSNVQEYAVCDLPGKAPKGDAVAKDGSATSGAGDGLRVNLAWNTGGLALRAQQPINASILTSGMDGKPFDQLEPVMGAYAHLVAFHEDRQTVLHIHPTGAEPQKPEDRGGPHFSFRFWAPKPGFYRLYVQVQVAGRQVFAPFALTVEP